MYYFWWRTKCDPCIPEMWHAVLIEEMKGVKREKEWMGEGRTGCTKRKTRDTSFSHNICILCLVTFYSIKPLNNFPIVFYVSDW
jgi:hypothetical protein